MKKLLRQSYSVSFPHWVNASKSFPIFILHNKWGIPFKPTRTKCTCFQYKYAIQLAIIKYIPKFFFCFFSYFILTKGFSRSYLDLYCVRLSNAAPFSENYAKLHFNAKHLEKGLNRSSENFWALFFSKNVPFFHKKYLFWIISSAALSF